MSSEDLYYCENSSRERHPGSLVDFSIHDPRLVQLMSSRVNSEMVEYIARQTVSIVRFEGESPIFAASHHERFPLTEYIHHLVRHAKVGVPTLLSTLIYLERLRTRLPNFAKETRHLHMRHRVFLSTLVVASKYLNDSTLKNEHWSKCSSFRIRDITVMETEVLSLLDYDLRFTEEEACEMFAPLMATYAQRASMRALAVDRVVKAGRARVQAQQITESSVESNSRPSPPRVSSTSSDLSSTACTLSEQLSNMHLSQSTASSPMYSTLSTGSTISTSSSDVGSLIDDTGSSSGSSSGWNSSDSESETEEHIEPQVYSNSSLDLRSHGDSARLVKPSSFVRSVPSYTQKNYQLRERSRKPSDTSSIRTITQSPLMSVHSRRCSAKRSTSISHAVAYNKGSSISSSATMPSISRGTSGNFLSRMWGAAKGQALGQDKTDCGDYTDGQGSSALRRLTLHTRPSFSRGLSNSNVNVV